MTTINLESFLRGNSQTTNTPEQSMYSLFQAALPQTSPDTPATITREDLRPNPAPAIALGVGVLLFLTLIRK